MFKDTIQKFLTRPTEKILKFCLRAQCILCGDRGEHNLSLCQGCAEDLPWLKSCCFQCGQPTPEPLPYCGACLSQPTPYGRTVATFLYDELMAACIGQFKFQRRLVVGKVLGSLMGRTLLQHYPNELPECIIPVPLHTLRLKERGFNQALELTYPISQALNLPINIQACQRLKATAMQSMATSAQARQKNLKNAFVVTQPLPEHVAIVDDVVTTGSTVAALAEALLAAGVKRVDVWCCARTVRKN